MTVVTTVGGCHSLGRRPMPGDDRHHNVTIGRHPVLVRDEPVGVTVEGEAHPAVDPGGEEGGMVAPQPRMMLNPSGSAASSSTLAPSLSNSNGAARWAAPLAQSSTTGSPSKVARLPDEMLHIDLDGVAQICSHPNTLAGTTLTIPT